MSDDRNIRGSTCRPGPWGDVKQPAGAHDRLEPDSAHSDRAQDFLRRHERVAADAVRRGTAGLREIGPALLERTVDTHNLRAAWDYLARFGGQAPGRNGLHYHDLDNNEVWSLLRTLKSTIHDGSYRHGPDRKVRHLKSSGTGYRTLTLENIEDRVVARGVVQVIQPLLDPIFSDDSYGFRPGRGREHALHNAVQLVATGNEVLVVADIKDAFDNVPLNRLLDIARLRLPQAPGLWRLIERIIENGTKRGLRQGNCLSPLLLNAFLDHLLDRPWKVRFPNLRLLRTADDLVIACSTEEAAHQAHRLLQELLRPTGLQIKETPEAAIRNLGNGDTADWLGYRISLISDGLVVRVGERAWTKLAQSLEKAHIHSGAPLYARSILYAWAGQLGATYASEDQDQVLARVGAICGRLALDEALREQQFLDCYRASYARWCQLRQNGAPRTAGTTGSRRGSSASPVFFGEDDVLRCDGAPSGAPSLFLARLKKATLFTDGCCDPRVGDGAWAVLVEAKSGVTDRSGYLPRTTNNRAELLAVIRGLEPFPHGAEVHVVTDSEYVEKGINGRLEVWKHQGWRSGGAGHRKPLRNVDLWRRLDELLNRLQVTCDWVNGHSGHPGNEDCDTLAYAAMLGGRRRAMANA